MKGKNLPKSQLNFPVADHGRRSEGAGVKTVGKLAELRSLMDPYAPEVVKGTPDEPYSAVVKFERNDRAPSGTSGKGMGTSLLEKLSAVPLHRGSV